MTHAAAQAPSRLRFWLVLLFSTAVLLRITYTLEMGSSFEFQRHTWKQTDMRYFHDWATQIASGDWLSRKVSMPHHSWLLRIQSPTAWKSWQKQRFYQAPGYPYLLALSLWWFHSLWPIFLLQMLLGLLIIALTYSIGRTLFSWHVGLLAAVLVSLYGPLLYLEPILLRSVPLTFLGLLLLWLGLRLYHTPSLWLFFVTGVSTGLSMLFKSTFVLALPLLMWLAFRPKTSLCPPPSPPISKLVAVFFLFLGCAFALSPLVVRNVLVGVSPTTLAANGALVFTQGNAPDAKPFPHFRSRSFQEVFLKTQGQLWPTIREILSQHSWSSFLKLHLIRTWSVLRHEEVPNNACFALAQQRSRLLSLLRVSYLWLVPLAFLGLLLCLTASSSRWIALLLLVFLGLHALSWIWGGHLMRYRVPITPILAILVAHAIHEGVIFLQQKRWTPVFAGTSIAVLLAVLINVPSAYRAVEIRTPDYLASLYHDIQRSRFMDACEVATLAAQRHPQRFRPFQSLLCSCHVQQQACSNENCLGQLWQSCERRFFNLLQFMPSPNRSTSSPPQQNKPRSLKPSHKPL